MGRSSRLIGLLAVAVAGSVSVVLPAGAEPAIDQTGSTPGGLVVTERALVGDGLVYNQFEDDTTWYVGTPGASVKTIDTTNAKGMVEQTVIITPDPKLELQKDKLEVKNPNHPDPLKTAYQLGLLTEKQFEKGKDWTAARSGAITPSASYNLEYYDGACAGSENGASKMYACYYRYRVIGYPDTFMTSHWGTAESKGIFLLRDAETGATYASGTGQIRVWRPMTTREQGSCTTITLMAGFRGAAFSASQEVCPEKLLPKISTSGKTFKARWQAYDWQPLFHGTRDPRSANGFHWFTRPVGTQSGFQFWMHHMAA